VKNIIKILFILSFSITFGQNEVTLDYSKIFPYRGNLIVTIFANSDKIENNFSISLLGEYITSDNTNENQIDIKTNKEKHLLFIEILKKYNTSNEIYYYNSDFGNKKYFYETNTHRIVKDVSNAILALQVDYIDICGNSFFIYIFDLKTSLIFLKELSNIYGHKKHFEKLMKIIQKP